jgi:phosphodiesterase/alkaline phosphatase D-like protein
MSMAITRRAFGTGVAAVCASAIASRSVASLNSQYSYHFRHYRRTNRHTHLTSVQLWARAIDNSDFASSVPITFQLATDSGLQSVLWQTSALAEQSASHVVRAGTLLTVQSIPYDLVLYAGLLLGSSPVVAQIRRVR